MSVNSQHQLSRLKFTLKRLLPILQGMLLMALALAAVRWRYEEEVLQALVRGTVRDGMSDEQRVLALVSRVHELMLPRKVLYNARGALKPNLEIDPVNLFLFDTLNELNTGLGGCGGFTNVAARVLESAGYEARIGQMLCRGSAGACHVFVEARISGKWAILDPLFNISFRSPDGHLASYAEVSRAWGTYQLQVPKGTGEADFPIDLYDFHGVRYTNWDKVPVLMPAIKVLLGAFTDADEISLRTYVMSRNRLWVAVLGLINLVWLGLQVTSFLSRRRNQPAQGRQPYEPRARVDSAIKLTTSSFAKRAPFRPAYSLKRLRQTKVTGSEEKEPEKAALIGR